MRGGNPYIHPFWFSIYETSCNNVHHLFVTAVSAEASTEEYVGPQRDIVLVHATPGADAH